MKRILKYELPGEGYTSMRMAPGPVIHVDEQDGRLCIWVEADVDAPTKLRSFHAVMTGQLFAEDDHLEHCGTALLINGHYVVHMYEERP